MHYSRTYLPFGSIVFLLIFYMLFPRKNNNVALLALKMCVFIDYLCSLFNEHCKEWLKNLRFVLLIIWYDQQNRRQEEIVTFLYTSLNLILICVINFKLMTPGSLWQNSQTMVPQPFMLCLHATSSPVIHISSGSGIDTWSYDVLA